MTDVTCYWDADDRDIGYDGPAEILYRYGHGIVCEIEHVAVVKTTFEAFLPPAEDADSDDDWQVVADTREAAEAAMAAELERRK